MNLLEGILSRRRMVMTAVVLLAFSGFVSWRGMVRQEDPSLPHFWGMVVVPFPGADAEMVERLLLEPLEEHLAEVDDLNLVESTARAEVAILQLELGDGTRDIPAAWDTVREAVAEARQDFPAGVGEARVRDDLHTQESIVLAITGSSDPRRLAQAARRIQRGLVALRSVSRVEITADPGEQITIELDDAVAVRLGIGPRRLAARLAGRNQILPGGSVRLGNKQATLRPFSEFESLEEIAATPIVLPSGAALPLSEVATVRHGPIEPATARMRLNGEMAVGLGVVPRARVNVVDFGRAVRERIEELRPVFPELVISEVIFQPDRVEERLKELSRSLLMGILIVAAVLILTMGWRLGLVVAVVVPMVALASLALYALGGGVLHQISIAALVIALGMLVDNAIVIAENIQARVNAGESAKEAAVASVRELAMPLAGATGTTMAAFIPMLAAQGTTAIFTRAIPVVIILTLTVSYLFAMVVTPTLARLALPRSKSAGTGMSATAQPGAAALGKISAGLARVAVGRPRWVVVLSLVVVAASLVASRGVRGQFFPASDRNQALIDLELPEGTHLDHTDRASRELESALSSRPEVVSVASFIGRSAPHFYYNLNQIPQSPNLAQLVVTTRDKAEVDGLVEWVRAYLLREMPEVAAVARKLEQGPSIAAPVEIRIFAEELVDLERMASAVRGAVEETPGTVDTRHNLGIGVPTVRIRVDDAAAARYELDRGDVARALFGRTRGFPAGQFRAGDDPVPVVVRSAAGEDFPVEALGGIDVAGSAGMRAGSSSVPLAQVARLETHWRPAAIQHRNGERTVAVLSQLRAGASHGQVMATLLPRLEGLELPPGVRWEAGGEAEGAGEANQAIARAAPLGMLLLVGILLAEFNSFRRVAIVLVTVPLSAAGVVPGLLIGDQPFGFMSLLGVVALIGVVVNNAIVLLDVIERERSSGAALGEALTTAIERRTRPILLTTATTVAGLLPLAFSSSSLWPPLAWAMISGLIVSTLLTLLVVPSLYLVLFTPVGALSNLSRRLSQVTGLGIAVVLVASTLLGFAPPVRGQTEGTDGTEGKEPLRLTLEEVMERAASRPRVEAAQWRALAAARDAVVVHRLAWWPSLRASAGAQRRSQEQILPTPLGDFQFGERNLETVNLVLTQPLFDPPRALYRAPAARALERARWAEAGNLKQEVALAAAEDFLTVLALDARLEATQALVVSLQAQVAETAERVAAGQTLKADELKLRLALDGGKQDGLALRQARRVALYELGRSAGLSQPAEPIPPVAWVATTAELSPASRGRQETELIERAWRQRLDLQAMDHRLLLLELQAEAVRAERLPRLDATARWSWTHGSPLDPEGQVEGGLALTWSPFSAGTRKPRAASIGAQAAALRAQREEKRGQIAFEVRAALAQLATVRGAIAVGQVGIEQATETVRVERQRFAVGRSTANDLLAGEAVLRDQMTRLELAKLERIRFQLRLDLAIGEVEIKEDAPALGTGMAKGDDFGR